MCIRATNWLYGLMLAFFMAPAMATLPECSPEYRISESLQPSEVVAQFLQAVDRGELRLFGQVLKRDMISPRQVEYIFTLDGAAPTIRVYSRLPEGVSVPGQTNCEAQAVAAKMSLDGHIIDSEAHIWFKQEEHSE